MGRAGAQMWRGRRPAAAGMAVAAVVLGGVVFPWAFVHAAENLVTIEHATLQTYPEANCTKVHIYLRNDGKSPAYVNGAKFNGKYLDFTLGESVDDVLAEVSGFGDIGAQGHAAKPPDRSAGALQWFRCLPNPIEPGAISDVTISLWGGVKEADVRVALRGGAALSWRGRDEKPALRLSHIAFDPAGEKIYVYCENKTDKPIRAERLFVNDVQFKDFVSIPTGGTIEPGGKSCLILRPKQWPGWGKYVGVGVQGAGAEEVVAVVRVMNLFPIGAWDTDTRADMFFDPIDVKRTPLAGGRPAGDCGAHTFTERSIQAFYDGMDPTCGPQHWEDKARSVIATMARLQRDEPGYPSYTHICKPVRPAYAFWGDVTDLVFMNPYGMHFRPGKPGESARLLALVRTWTDPRPVLTVPEAFARKNHGNLTPDEVSYSLWAEMSAGAKGVRYYFRAGSQTANGYDQMPGVAQIIAHNNLDLQLIKGFLRIGDTYDCVVTNDASVDSGGLLCGDRGAVIILLNRQFSAAREDAAWQWKPSPAVEVRVRVPEVLRPAGVHEVDQGLTPLRFTETAGTVTFRAAPLRVRRVYLISPLFSKERIVASPVEAQRSNLVSAVRQSTVSVTSVLDHCARYRAAVQIKAQPFLHPDALVGPDAALATGICLGEERERSLLDLRRMEDGVWQLHPHQRIAAARALVETYASMREWETAEGAVELFRDGMPAPDVRSLTLCMGHASVRGGNYDVAAAAFAGAHSASENRFERLESLASLISLYETNLRDYAQAAHWAKVRIDACRGDPHLLAAARLHTALLLLSDDKAHEAAELIKEIDAKAHRDLAVECALGACYLRLGQCEVARSVLRRASEMQKPNADFARFLLAKAFAADGQMQAADRELTELRRTFPMSPYADRSAKLAHAIEATQGNSPPKR